MTDGECESLATAGLWVAGDLRAMNGVYVPPTGSGILRVGYPTSDFPEDVEEVTVRIRDTGGTVVLERSVPVDDYREEPAHFEIACSSLEAHRIAPGEAVTATVDVRNRGYDPGYLATLETDGDVLVEQRGEVPTFLDDAVQRCDGSRLTLSHAIEEPGEYDLTVRIAPAADGSAAIRRLGTVRVGGTEERRQDGANDLPLEPVVGVGAGAAALVLGYVWYRGTVRED